MEKESKYFNTAFLFDEALISLLENKDIEYITVKEICSKAGFNRSTFYLHYDSISDLLNESSNYMINKMVSRFNREPKKFLNDLNKTNKEELNFINEEYLKPYLEFIRDNKKFFIAVFKNPNVVNANNAYKDLERYILNPILEKYNIPAYKRKYMIQYYINGIVSIIKEWVTSDCDLEIDEIINIIVECVNA